MERIFIIIASISALMVLIAGGGSYWFSAAKVSNSEKTAILATANSLASVISMQLLFLQQTVDGLSRDPDVIAALSSGDAELINSMTNKLLTVVPGALKVRLLPPNISEPDQTSAPYMGFGDLEMVRATLAAKQKPVIQGEGEHRHLALTSAVIQNERVIGVILVSLKTDLINQAISKIKFAQGFAEIKQDQLILGSSGNQSDKINDPETIPLGDSRWIVQVWTDAESGLADKSLVFAIIFLPALLACLAFFAGYRILVTYLLQDQSSILKAAKDMMKGRNVGNYPVQLNEMRPIITTLAQFKRVMNEEDIPLKTLEATDESHFFDESFDIDYQEESTPLAIDDFADNLDDTILDSTPITMPVMEPPTTLHATKGLGQVGKTRADIFRCYDIRGIVGQDLNEEIVADIGRAIASEAKQLGIKTIIIARDGRLSSPSLATALSQGICSTGCDVMDIGLVPTPLLYFVAHHAEGHSGIMITGSHNPPDYNGLKIVLNGETLAESRIQAIKNRIVSGDYSVGAPGSVTKNGLITNEYIGVISEAIHIARPMKVVLDCGNGAAGELGPVLLKTLGCEVVELYCDIDGGFPNHHPDPSKPENMADLASIVKLHAADLGIAFDGDGDGLGIVDSNGKIIWPDRQLMLFARDVLSNKMGAEIIYDVKCSRHLQTQIQKRGGKAVMWKTGHALMKAKLKQTGAMLAGEMSGHFYFNDYWFGFDDALYAAARMIQILSEDSRSSSDVFAELPDSINTPELTIPMAEGESIRFIDEMSSSEIFLLFSRTQK